MTTIQFIGLLIITSLSSSGAHVVMGTVPGIIPIHDSIIAYLPGDREPGTTWERAGSIVIQGEEYDFVHVDRDNIRFLGPTEPFAPVLPLNLPHLSCCCQTMERIRPEYADANEPAETKAAAHIDITNGTYASYEIPDTSGAIGTQLTLTQQVELTIEGRLGSRVRLLVLKPGSSVVFANTPFQAFEHPGEAHNHFLAYYNMGAGAATCTAQPSEGNKCNPFTTLCPLNPPAAKASQAKPPLKKAATMPPKKLLPILIVDINCSNSQWP